MTDLPDCSPSCKSFKCEARPPALKVVQERGKKRLWCVMVDDTCDGAWCQYSYCAERKMTPEGKCKRNSTRLDLESVVLPEDLEDPSAIPRKYVKKLREKKIT
ncbi:MAG: hypothetical protein HXY34_11025 [Candidatus Thorarchaeota archaeon]|nr:hypothetical protein [Candidatus Thorarchaeota archaeon]